MVFEPNASASLSQTCWAIERRSATRGYRRIKISRMPSSVAVREGRYPETSASRAAGSNSTSPILIPGGLADRWPALQRAQPGQQLTEVERLDQVVIRAGVQPGDPVGGGVPRGQHQHRRGRAAAAQPAHQFPRADRGMRQSRTATS